MAVVKRGFTCSFLTKFLCTFKLLMIQGKMSVLIQVSQSQGKMPFHVKVLHITMFVLKLGQLPSMGLL